MLGLALGRHKLIVSSSSWTETKRVAGISVGASVATLIAAGVVFWIYLQEKRGRERLNQYVSEFVEKREASY